MLAVRLPVTLLEVRGARYHGIFARSRN